MDLRKYLDNRRRGDDTTNERRGPRNDMENRNPIGFVQDSTYPKYDEYRRPDMMAHKEYDFEPDDFEEAKESSRYTPTGVNRGHKMTMDELIDKMSKSFKKELCDVMRYCKMAETAEEAGLTNFANGLYEMCHEEFTHASFLRANLKHFGRDPEKTDPEVAKLWQKVSQKYEES